MPDDIELNRKLVSTYLLINPNLKFGSRPSSISIEGFRSDVNE